MPAAVREDGWPSARVALQKLFKGFGPIVNITCGDAVVTGQLKNSKPALSDGDDVLATIRFGNSKAAENAMAGAPQGYMPLGDGEIRVRQPASRQSVWRNFPKSRPPENRPGFKATEEPKKKKLRPNERFAAKHPQEAGVPEDADESERFWDEQKRNRGAPGVPPWEAGRTFQPGPGQPGGEIPAGEGDGLPSAQGRLPDKPMATAAAELKPEASEEDKEVWKGEEAVSKEMDEILEKPFSQQKKALKALRLKWHPDKNPDNAEVCTRVFQFIQAHDDWLAHHGLGSSAAKKAETADT
eukprot:gnl/TRDRNA2_/TRDRNA2_156874_c0_seq3.p1 gnl/TRDRNA2_/TRDRNA2_156874_c0~~gnl/TRDRNA2_/TRDRNA2_156874_c0_seq3.p1  ORF type:complete len:306 (+),score=78.20 gnl/TRDRNA2_/TRDRNA2_156874_c0_seq3:26-919(+)